MPFLEPEPTNVVVDVPLRIIHYLFRAGKISECYMEWVVIILRSPAYYYVKGFYREEDARNYIEDVRGLVVGEDVDRWEVVYFLHNGIRQSV